MNERDRVSEREKIQTNRNFTAVSYTHLDVYKRQGRFGYYRQYKKIRKAKAI